MSVDDNDGDRIRTLIEELWGGYDEEPTMIGTVVIAVSFVYPDGETRSHTFYNGRRTEARGLALDLVDDLAAKAEGIEDE